MKFFYQRVSVLRTSNEMPALKDVLTDIMGLTKINYNACNFNDGLPVIVRFADTGEVTRWRSGAS